MRWYRGTKLGKWSDKHPSLASGIWYSLGWLSGGLTSHFLKHSKTPLEDVVIGGVIGGLFIWAFKSAQE